MKACVGFELYSSTSIMSRLCWCLLAAIMCDWAKAMLALCSTALFQRIISAIFLHQWKKTMSSPYLINTVPFGNPKSRLKRWSITVWQLICLGFALFNVRWRFRGIGGVEFTAQRTHYKPFQLGNLMNTLQLGVGEREGNL